MKRSSARAFTLIEMLMVMLIIAIISAIVVSVAGYANKKAAASRAQSEMSAFSSACEKYKGDNGTYPRLADGTGSSETPPIAGGTEQSTDAQPSPIDPRLHGNPTASAYKNASLFLYRRLSGDDNMDGRAGDSTSGTPNTVYYEFKSTMMGGVSASTPIGTASVVKFLQDPYGFSYGYSTAGAAAEEKFRADAAADQSGNLTRSAQKHGFNPTFDMWCTAGTVIDTPTDETRQRWVKNW